MLNRRTLLSGVAAAAATVSIGRSVRAAAPAYDLVVKGGRVIDPSRALDATVDIAVANGKIAAVAADIPPGAAEVVDARGKLAVPGLIDIHTHTGVSRKVPVSC